MADAKTETPAAAAPAPAAGKKGGGSWLPLIIVIVAMPALAFVSTKFLIVPQIHQALGGGHATEASAGAASHGGGGGGGGGHGKAATATRAFFNKMIVNVAGTMGTRYLLTSLTLVGEGAAFPTKVDERRDQLLDLVTATLRNKTITELEKPEAQNQIRAELLAVFNDVLTETPVKELYLTEFVIQ